MAARLRSLRLIGVIAVLGAVACGGGDGGGTGPVAGERADAGRLVAPPAFAAAVRDPATFVLNVHVPDAGSIPGTDAEIPFDSIAAKRAALPSRDTRIAVYCRTGAMSAVARRELGALGYRRTVELSGGMKAWEASGRRLLPPG